MRPVPPPTVETDLACIHCGYNLRTLSSGGKCPECATPIWRSRLTRPDFRAFQRFERVQILYGLAVFICFGASWYVRSSMSHTSNGATAEQIFMKNQCATASLALLVIGLIWLVISRYPRKSRFVWAMLALSILTAIFLEVGGVI
jgi:cell division protein FtsW (lipid II flippase)